MFMFLPALSSSRIVELIFDVLEGVWVGRGYYLSPSQAAREVIRAVITWRNISSRIKLITLLCWSKHIWLKYVQCKTLKIHVKFLAVHNSSIGDLVTNWLTEDFTNWHYRVTLETCDLWDLRSEWWGNMTWPTFWQFVLQILTLIDILFDNFQQF